MYTTEVLTIEKTGELSRSPDDISTKTMRTRAYRCLDINDDKLPDIPVEKSFPAYERNKQQENLTYVEWYDYDGTSLSFLKTAYTSLNEQFMIELPRDWIGSITIQRDSDTERAVHFYYIDKDDKSDTAEPIPMFSVRVFSPAGVFGYGAESGLADNFHLQRERLHLPLGQQRAAASV